MTLTIDVIDKRGPSNKMHRHLYQKETKVTLHYLCNNTKSHFTLPSSLTRQSALVLKVGVSYEWKIKNTTPVSAKQD